ncbi:hypothetical protein MRB53_033177 [Persea americana]|uniref:Uncharacterized protein n=1 Tax=Persea americana TaxID=3435 RepID=A0ACC2KUZ8_PERAE|nr:hypothetical protein MRB53_033177 [Persea americana]
MDPNPLGHIHKSKTFRFENLWLREVDCVDVIRNSWISSAGSPIQREISMCGSALLEWGGHLARDFRNRMSDCKRRMVLLRGRRDQEGMDEFTETRNRYNAILHSHEVFWKQRSKPFWLKEGDMNSRYFHMTASARKRKNTFVKLHSNQGHWCSTPDEIDSMIVEYFRNLFTSGGYQSEELLNCVEMKVTSEQNSMLMAPFSAIEVKEALFGMHPDKSPGPDGMNPAFYQKFWHIVGEDVTSNCLSFINTCFFLVGLNDTLIVLIPKKQLEVLLDMRPIALRNVLYKIVSKMIANRMKTVLATIVSEFQNAFVPGRAITDSILISTEIMHFLKRKGKGKSGVAALKIDMSKAYDRIEWDFLKSMMLKLGFDAKWVEMIMLSVSTISYSVIRDGKEQEACLVKDMLAVYGRDSGQMVNFNKSSVSFTANALTQGRKNPEEERMMTGGLLARVSRLGRKHDGVEGSCYLGTRP